MPCKHGLDSCTCAMRVEEGAIMTVLIRYGWVTVAALALFLAAGGSTGAASTAKAPKKPSASISNAAVTEGNSGTVTVSFRVKLSAPAIKAASVKFATVAGTATAGSDYQVASGTLRFKHGDRSKTISVSVVGDTVIEPDETMSIRLSGPVNLKIAKATAIGTITNDDFAPKSGPYSGQTSQGKPISFDVATDVTSLTHFKTALDLSCTEVPVILRNVPFDLANAPIPLTSTWTFNLSVPFSDSDGSGNVALSGGLSTTAPATGAIKFDIAIYTDAGTVHCSTGNVTWTAAPAS